MRRRLRLRTVPTLITVAALAALSVTLSAQIVRTADATVRGLRESDFPRIIKLAENV